VQIVHQGNTPSRRRSHRPRLVIELEERARAVVVADTPADELRILDDALGRTSVEHEVLRALRLVDMIDRRSAAEPKDVFGRPAA
jgi:hypothetical protein